MKYCKELADILLSFKGQEMTLTVDSFTKSAEISMTVISNEAFSKSNYGSDEICELANSMDQNFKPYRFILPIDSTCNFCDSDGNPLNLSLYNCYVVHGDSMKYAGINVAYKIMAMPKFRRLNRQEGYKGPEWMIDDLKRKRLYDYKEAYFKDGVCPEQYKDIIISTTFDTVKKAIHFSIHPVSLIVGNVEESYTI